MDVSFQPKSTQPEDAKKGPTLADVVAMYKGEKKSTLVILLTAIIPVILLAIFGLMAMKSSLESELAQKKQELEQKDSQMPVKPADMAEMRKLSDRITIVSTAVNSHPFMTTFLKLLEYSVEDDVVFQKTTLSGGSSKGSETYAMSIDARGRTYSSILNQIQTLRDEAPYKKFFRDIRMENFSIDKKGYINFKISGIASIQGANMTADEVEKELLKVLSAKEMPSREALQSLNGQIPPANQVSSSTTP